MNRRLFLTGAAALPLAARGWPSGPPAEYLDELRLLMRSASVPGAVAGVVREHKLAWIAPMGVLQAGSDRAVTSATLFQAASLTKQVTAYAVFALREKGKLDFDRTLVSYVDDLSNEASRRVTIRHVLSQSSGFPNWRRAERGKPVPDLEPAFPPGSRYRYSGEGFVYLQRVMEEVAGQGIAQVLQELVFEPLGMKSSSVVWDPESAARTAVPHNRQGEPAKNWDRRVRALHEYAAKLGKPVASLRYSEYSAVAGEPALPDNVVPNAASSLVTSADDYARFLCAAVRNRAIAEQQVAINEFLGWGLGWATERIANRTYVWQWGDNPGFKNFVLAEPATGNAVFVFTNGDSGARVYDRLVTHVSGHDHPALFWL
jgi:CubicO group peptidase (beta-lactamase class C family)